MTRPVVGLCLLAAAAAGLVGSAEATRPSHGIERRHEAAEVRVPVESARLVCPRTSPSPASTDRLTIVAPARVGTGSAAMAARDPANPLPKLRLDSSGTAATVDARLTSTDPVVSASGTLASGVVADAARRVDDGRSRGINGARCTAPGTDMWFVGGLTTPGRNAVLLLLNVDPLPATVDVSFSGPHGPIFAPSARGLTVAPGGSRVLSLVDVVPGERDLAVHVVARAGRVGAFVEQHVLYGNSPGGNDYIPSIETPQLSSVVPGLPNGLGYRRVILANPGEDDATARVTLVTSDGSFVPQGMSEVRVEAHSTARLDVTEALAQQSGAVVADSDRPLLVTAIADTGPRVSGIGEFAWSAAVPPLDGLTPIGLTSIGRASSTIFLSAPSAGGTVEVTLVGASGASSAKPRRVVVGDRRTVSVDLPLGLKGNVAAVLELVDGAGPVYAARELLEVGARGPLYTIEPVVSGRGFATLRPVVPDLRVSEFR